MTDLTFVVPVAPYHEALLEHTLASVTAQTAPCEAVVVYDVLKRGAGWARNEGIRQVKTEFLVFLDADDEVLPTFAERTLSVWQPGRFVYVDWYDGETVFHAPKCPWMANTRNIITSLVSTQDARRVGGFDESLAGMEDTQFFLKLLSNRICGLHVHEPLFRYRKDGQRSKAFYQTDAYYAAIERFNREFGRLKMADESCGGCGGSPYAMPEVQNLPIGEQLAGDVLVKTLWAGNRSERGRVTGRLYARAGNGKQLWVDPRDLHSAPHLFASVIEMPPALDTLDDDGFQQFADQIRASFNQQAGKVQARPAPQPVRVVPLANVEVKPDVEQVMRLYHPKS